MDPCYRYRASLIRVIDGDTVVARVDLGFRVSAAITIRLNGYDTPERNETGWSEASKLTEAALSGGNFVIESYKDKRSFERWVCDVYTTDGSSLGERLLEEGLAVKGESD